MEIKKKDVMIKIGRERSQLTLKRNESENEYRERANKVENIDENIRNYFSISKKNLKTRLDISLQSSLRHLAKI